MAKKKKNDQPLPQGRKSYYGFSQDYPGRQGVQTEYKSTVEKRQTRKKILRGIAAACGLFCIFVVGYFITHLALDISNKPIVVETQPGQTDAQQGGDAQPQPQPSGTGTQARQAFYIPAAMLGDTQVLASLLDRAKGAGMNAIVIDVKNSDGTLSYESGIADVNTAQASRPVATLAAAIATAKEKGFAVIGRIYCYEDPLAAGALSDAAVHYRNSTDLWFDNSPSKGGKPWLNPYSARAQKYLLDIIGESVNTLSLDSVLLDGVQFPSGYSLNKATFDGEEESAAGRNETLTAFVASALDAAGGANKVILAMTGDSALNGSAELYDGSLMDASAGICAPDLRVGKLPAEVTVGHAAMKPAQDTAAFITAACKQLVSRATLGGRSTPIMPVLDAGSTWQAVRDAATAAGVSGYVLYSETGSYTF